jgi:hypothetical protein
MTKSDKPPRHHPGAGTRRLAAGEGDRRSFSLPASEQAGLVTVPHPVRDVTLGALAVLRLQAIEASSYQRHQEHSRSGIRAGLARPVHAATSLTEDHGV